MTYAIKTGVDSYILHQYVKAMLIIPMAKSRESVPNNTCLTFVIKLDDDDPPDWVQFVYSGTNFAHPPW